VYLAKMGRVFSRSLKSVLCKMFPQRRTYTWGRQSTFGDTEEWRTYTPSVANFIRDPQPKKWWNRW